MNKIIKFRDWQEYDLLKIQSSCSKWPPFICEHSRTRRSKLSMVRRHMSGVMPLTTRRISCFNSNNVWGAFLYTLFFMYPHRKKSQGFRSGEWADQMFVVLRDMILSAKVSTNICRVSFATWGVAPSCWNHWVFIAMPLLFRESKKFFRTLR